MYKLLLCLLLWLLATVEIFTQEYQLKWEKNHFPSVFTDVKFSNDGNYIYAVMSPNLFIISAETGEILDRFNAEASGEYDASGIRKLYVPDNGKYIITFHNDSDLNYWDTETWEHSHFFRIPRDDSFGINGIDISEDGKLLIYNMVKRVNDLAEENIIVKYNLDEQLEISRKGYPFQHHNGFELKLFPNKEKFLVATQRLYINNLLPGEDKLTLWNAETMEIERIIDEKSYGENDIVKDYFQLYTSPDNQKFAYIKSDNYTCRIHSTSDYSKIYESKTGVRCERMIFFNNSDNIAFTYGFDFDLINIPSGVRKTFEHHSNYIILSNENDQLYTGITSQGFLYSLVLDLSQDLSDINLTSSKDSIVIDNPNRKLIKSIRILNLQGKDIINKSINKNDIKIYDNYELSSGVYFVKIEIENNILFKKIMIGE